MKTSDILSLLLAFAATASVNAFSNGAPTQSCGLNLPITNPHSAYKNDGQITVKVTDTAGKAVTTYVPGATYNVQLTSTAQFFGFLIGANPSSGADGIGGDILVGDAGKALNCGGFGISQHVTNTAKAAKTVVNAKWVAPMVNNGPISLQASVYRAQIGDGSITTLYINAPAVSTIKGQTTTQAPPNTRVTASPNNIAGGGANTAQTGTTGTTGTTGGGITLTTPMIVGLAAVGLIVALVAVSLVRRGVVTTPRSGGESAVEVPYTRRDSTVRQRDSRRISNKV